ncbi:uncharacterized protein O3C94_019600 [Discoglossus pictus]
MDLLKLLAIRQAKPPTMGVVEESKRSRSLLEQQLSPNAGNQEIKPFCGRGKIQAPGRTSSRQQENLPTATKTSESLLRHLAEQGCKVSKQKLQCICAKCNAGHTEKPPQRHLAKSLYPFQRIQIDHIQMPKSGRYEYALVIVDMFSGWPEAYPVVNMTAKTTVKRLLTEVICRYGVPEVIESDQGPAFTAVLAKEIWTALGVTLSFHTPYHPQSSGKVEQVITGTHQLLPGDWVLVKKFVRKTPLEPRYEGPFQVLLITATSVKLEGKATWVHASHCKKVPPPDDQEPTQ